MNRKLILFTVIFLVSGVLAFTQDRWPRLVDNFVIGPVTNDSIRIQGYRGRETNIKIPDTIGGYRVVEIGAGDDFMEYPFRGLTSVMLPRVLFT